MTFTPGHESTSHDFISACQCGRRPLPSVAVSIVKAYDSDYNNGDGHMRWRKGDGHMPVAIERQTPCDVILSVAEWHHSTPGHAACALGHSARAIRDVDST